MDVIDEPTGRVICELDNPMRDPGDGTIITATNISIVTYAGDGKWRRQEDIYNPCGSCRHRSSGAEGPGTRHPRRRGRGVDQEVGVRSRNRVTELVIGANGISARTSSGSWSATAEDVRVMVRAGANTVGIDDLEVTRFVGDIFDTDDACARP